MTLMRAQFLIWAARISCYQQVRQSLEPGDAQRSTDAPVTGS
jgi:hypothetical protein